MSKNDCGNGRRCTFSLQKHTALEYQKKMGIPYYTPGILDHIPLYEKSLQVGITVISARCGNKRVYKGNSSYKLQVTLYHISDEGICHFAVITHINALLSRTYYIIATIAIKVSTTGIIIGVQFGATFVEEMDAFLMKKMLLCNVPSVMLHVIPCPV